MDSLFMVLLFIFGACLVVGLVNPIVFKRIFKKYSNRKIISLVFIPLIIASGILFTVFAKGIPYLDEIKTPTNQNLITVSGTNAFNDSPTKIYLNSELKGEIKADNQGKFSFNNLELKEGENKVKVSSISMKGRIRQSSEELVVLDTLSPSLVIETPQSPTELNKLDIKGSSEANSEIVVFKNEKEVKKEKINKADFLIKGIALDEGENKFKVVARDEAGNESGGKDLNINYIPKKVSPTAKPSEENKTQTSTPTNTIIPALTYKEATSYQKSGETWKLIVLSKKPTNDELINAAKELHSKDKTAFYSLFDSDEKITEFRDWDINYGKVRDRDGVVKLPTECGDTSYCLGLFKKGEYAFNAPQDWIDQHEIGIINKMMGDNGLEWSLSSAVGEKISNL